MSYNHKSKVCTPLLVFFIFWILHPFPVSQAQTTSITSSGLNTRVGAPTILPNGQVNYDITGGTRPGQGPNLFHSFGNFSIAQSNIANFLNNTGLATSNILARVTGGNPSQIFGTIQTTGFPGANLFLINPAGVLFGPTASLNVSGSVNISTADYLRFADGLRFKAMPGPQDVLLSAAPVAAFGFLGPHPAPISVQGALLEVLAEQTLSLIGGNLQVTGFLGAPGGQIQLASVASRGEVRPSPVGQSGGLAVTPHTKMGTITLGSSTGLGNAFLEAASSLQTPAHNGGAVIIRGGKIMMDNTAIGTSTQASDNPAATGIDIVATNSVSIGHFSEFNTGFSNPSLGFGTGHAGPLSISAPSVALDNSSIRTTEALGGQQPGSGGAITLNVGNLTLSGRNFRGIDSGTGNIKINATGDVTITSFEIAAATVGAADSGQVSISADTLTMNQGATIRSSTSPFGADSGGRSGNITIDVDKLIMQPPNAFGFPTIITFGGGAGGTGNITVTAKDLVRVDSGFINTNVFGSGNAGNISISTPHLTLNDRSVVSASTTGTGRAGDITLNVGRLKVLNGATIDSGTSSGGSSNGNAGNITISADKSVTVSGFSAIGTTIVEPSAITAASAGSGDAGQIHISAPLLQVDNRGVISTSTGPAGAFDPLVTGKAGQIILDVGRLNLMEGARIESASLATCGCNSSIVVPNIAPAGTVSVNASGQVALSGADSGLFANTQGAGAGGAVNIQANRVSLTDGATISAASTGTGSPGMVSGDAARTISIDNGAITAAGPGQGGNVSLHAGQSIHLRNGSLISVDNTGVGNAGNIVIDAGTAFLGQNSIVSAQAGQGHGGTIILQAPDAVRLNNSRVTTSIGGGPDDTAGNIVVESNLVRLRNSQIVSDAAVGQGGSIIITTPAFHPDAASTVEAVSLSGGSDGTVVIRPPTGP